MLEVGFDNGNVSLNYAPGLEDSDFLDTNITFKKVPWLVAGPFPPGSYVSSTMPMKPSQFDLFLGI